MLKSAEREMHQPNTKGHYGIRSVFGGRVDCGRIHRHLGVVAAVSKLGRTPGDSAADGRRICRPSHTTDGGVTIDGKVTADGESASDIDGQPTDHSAKRLVIALILTIPTFVITLLALAKIAMPGWLTNPWPHAIVITPVMFYCAAPIHHRGLPHCSGGVRTAIRLVSLGGDCLRVQPAAVRGVVDFPGRLARSVFRVRRRGRDAFAGWHACPATRDDRAADGRNRKGAIGTVNRINRIGAISSEIP